MSHWQDQPDDQTRSLNYRIHRTPAGRDVELLILSRKWVGARLHYWRGRTTPCAGAKCQACMDGQRPRWKGYLQCYHAPTRSIVIFEYTDRGHEEFAKKFDQVGNLRGFRFVAGRLNKKPNGPLSIRIGDTREESPHMPKEVDLQEMLDRIWEIRQKDLDVDAQTA